VYKQNVVKEMGVKASAVIQKDNHTVAQDEGYPHRRDDNEDG
jgi:hypothetical protein